MSSHYSKRRTQASQVNLITKELELLDSAPSPSPMEGRKGTTKKREPIQIDEREQEITENIIIHFNS